MKKTFYTMIAWVILVVGLLFIISPIIPGIPLLALSAFLFTLGAQKN